MELMILIIKDYYDKDDAAIFSLKIYLTQKSYPKANLAVLHESNLLLLHWKNYLNEIS